MTMTTAEYEVSERTKRASAFISPAVSEPLWCVELYGRDATEPYYETPAKGLPWNHIMAIIKNCVDPAVTTRFIVRLVSR